MEKQTQNVVVKSQKRGLTVAERATLATGAMLVGSTAFAADGVDVSAGTAVIAGGVAVIALIGAAKIVPNATIQVWGYVKQAFNRT